MDKRTFLKNSVIALSGMGLPSVITSCTSSRQGKPKRRNWVWSRPNPDWSYDDWKKNLDVLKEVGIDAILVEIYNGNETFYEGGQLPLRANIMDRLIPACQSAGIELHAWMWIIEESL